MFKATHYGNMLRNRFKRIFLLGFVFIFFWLSYVLINVSSDNHHTHNSHRLNQKNIDNVNFIVENVFKEDISSLQKKYNDIPVMIDESNKEKLKKKLNDAIDVVNGNPIVKDINSNNEKINPIVENINENNGKISINEIKNSNGNKVNIIDENLNPNSDENKKKLNVLPPSVNRNFFNNIDQNDYANGFNNRKNPQANPEIQTAESYLKNLERVVHIDLKGAPPKPDYFKSFIPFLKQNGATGILLEYEDTFPWEGRLSEAKNGRAYTLEDIKMIKDLAKQNNLYIIPLVQTYGHLEWLLKLKSFSHLREASDFPQVITPCLDESYALLYELLDQVIKQHNDVPYFHIGCDEVYYKLTHQKCREKGKNDFTTAYLEHLVQIATYVRKQLPNAKIMFWDDMLQGMNEDSLTKFKSKIELLQLTPMMWGYMEDVASYFQPQIYDKYGRIFGKIWIATAYKGASGELATLTSIQHHYLNHLSWIDVMRDKVSRNVVNFTGVAFTGWSRYDHFLQLCDLLPQAIPSLVFNLQLFQHGRLSEDKKQSITRDLGCSSQIPWFGQHHSYASLTCTFPGHEVYEAMLPLGELLKSIQPNIEFAQKYMQPLNLDNNHLHKQRALEVKDKLNYNYQSLINFKDKFIKACDSVYYPDTAVEWLTVYLVPDLDKVHYILSKIKSLWVVNDWKPRPLLVTLKQYPQSL